MNPVPAEVIAFAKKNLAGYKVPKSVIVVADLPRLGSGKPDRRALALGASAAQSQLAEA
jgi:acyl-CoA synthetase (AMP-forming)/AMP-acid ligase II